MLTPACAVVHLILQPIWTGNVCTFIRNFWNKERASLVCNLFKLPVNWTYCTIFMLVSVTYQSFMLYSFFLTSMYATVWLPKNTCTVSNGLATCTWNSKQKKYYDCHWTLILVVHYVHVKQKTHNIVTRDPARNCYRHRNFLASLNFSFEISGSLLFYWILTLC